MPALSYLKISATPYEAGRQLGLYGAPAVHRHLLDSRSWSEVMAWRGSDRVAAMAKLVRERFPRIWSELEGLAAGLRLPFDEVFLWNCRGDVWAFAPDGCTTVLLPGDAVRRIAHNEDGDPGFAGDCAVVEYAVDGQPRLASFVYPGSIPGHTFAVTSNGLAVTVNNIRVRQATVGVPRMVLARAVLDAADAQAAVALLRDHPRAGGFHLAIGCTGEAQLLSVEYGAFACSSQAVAQPMVHANHAVHAQTRNFPQLITGSSGFRQIRGESLLAQGRQAVDPLAILSDTGHPTYPIYRTDPADSDDENTMATADIHVTTAGVDWQVRESPSGPVRFKMRGAGLSTQD